MKKSLKIVKSAATWLLVIAAVAMMIFTVVSVNTFDQADRSLFGYKIFIVLSDSMSTVNGDSSKGYFDAGDLALAKEVDPSTLKAGDIIAYSSTNIENYGRTVTHMIRRVTTDEDGNPGFVTYGTSTNTDDAEIVTYSHVIGKYTGKIPKLGKFFQFLKTTPGYIICIFVPFVLLVCIQGFNSVRLFKKYKKEQLSVIEEERQKVREENRAELEAMVKERKKQEAMMKRLMQMQSNQTAPQRTVTATKKKVQPKSATVKVRNSTSSRRNGR